MFQPGDQSRFTGKSGVEHLERYPTVQLAVVRRINHAHPAPANLVFENVARSREIGNRRYMPQVIENRVAQVHMRRFSSRSSRSPDVTARIRSLTNARSVRRAHARSLVTVVSATPWSVARSA